MGLPGCRSVCRRTPSHPVGAWLRIREVRLTICLLATVLLGSISCNRTHPTRYIVPAGYFGWVQVTYDIPEGYELAVEDGFVTAKIDYFRRMRVKNHMNPTWDGAEYYAQDPTGKRIKLPSTGSQKLIWGNEKISDREGERETFFVGTEQLFTIGLNRAIHLEGSAIQPPLGGRIDLPPADQNTRILVDH